MNMAVCTIMHFCNNLFQCGVIEVVPDSKSRDKIGKQTQVSLKEYFRSVYGSEDSVPYQEVYTVFSITVIGMVSVLMNPRRR